EDSFELHSVDLELEAVEKQIRKPTGEADPAATAESRVGKRPGNDAHLSQAQRQRARPAQVSFTPAPGYDAAWMQQQRKTRAKPRARTSPPPPPPVFEIPTQNRFAPLRETGVTGDHRRLHRSARTRDPEEEHRSCGPPCWHERHQAEADGDPEEGLQEPGGAGTHHIAHDEDHLPGPLPTFQRGIE
ncbi:hypothetical protein QTP86_021666, partial [Hemibagrus guttatus]